MGNTIVSPVDSIKKNHAIFSTEYSSNQINKNDNPEELQNAIKTFNIIINKLLSHQSQNQFMIKNEPELQQNINKKALNEKTFLRARASSVGSSDEDTKIQYKNLFRKQNSFIERNQTIRKSQQNIHEIIPAMIHQQNIATMYKSSEQKFNKIINPFQQISNVSVASTVAASASASAAAATETENSSVINLPEILDETDEITILRHLIKLLSIKINKLNDEKKQLFQHISTINQINQELLNIIQERFQK